MASTIALVTGANKGIGRAVAAQLAGPDAVVLLGCRDADRGAAAAKELADQTGSRVESIRLDVTDQHDVDAAAERIRRDHDRLDVLVNNAGTLAERPALEITATQLRETFEVNVVGVVSMIRAMLPLLRLSAAPRIVNVTSTTASLGLTTAGRDFGGTDDRLDYSSSKTALNMLTVQYAEAFGRSEELSHIRINAVTPGYVATDLTHHRASRTPEQGARPIVALTRIGADGPSGGFLNEDGPVPW